jgi:DNA-binding transcriptional ArsR family regulator
MLRALAHPARIKILQHLALEGQATATECAEIVGLSPSACSYHLRALAKHGFVEADQASAADGRQRPWRARIVAFTFGDDPAEPAVMQAASKLLLDTFQARFEEVRAQYLSRRDRFSQDWRAGTGVSQDVLHLTAPELPAFRTELHELIGRYRRLDQAERPPGARRVYVSLDLIPWFDPDSGQ